MARLLSLNSYHYRRGGADVVYLDHASLFASSGWQTAFMSMHHPENLPCEWSQYFVRELQYGHRYSIAEKAAMAVKVVWSTEAQRNTARLIRDFKPDVAHAHNLYHHLSPSVLTALSRAGVPAVMTAHDYKLACPAHEMLLHGKLCEQCRGGRFLNCLKNRCIKDSLALSGLVAVESALHSKLGSYVKHLSRIVAPSRFMSQKLIEWGVPPSLLRHIPNAVRPEEFRVSSTIGDYFVYFGRLTESKGVRTLVAAAKQADVKLKVVGTGELEPAMREIADGDRIQVLGRRTGGDLWDVVSHSRAVVLPSEWYENAPMSILESYALGKPVLGASIGGIPEMIRENETGWLFPSTNTDALSTRLSDVARLPEARLRLMGAEARRHLEENYSQEQYFNRTITLYRELGVRC